MKSFRVGLGYDLHQLVDQKINQFPFKLGGITIPFDKSCIAHSDGDVLIHALCDALLGAAALEDIGTHFPDNEKKWHKGNSEELAQKVVQLIHQEGWHINNIDATIVLEEPKLAPYKELIKNNIAQIAQIPPHLVSIKAKTNEKMDSIGEGLAVAAHVVVLLISNR